MSLLGVTSVVGGQFALIPQHLATTTALQPWCCLFRKSVGMDKDTGFGMC